MASSSRTPPFSHNSLWGAPLKPLFANEKLCRLALLHAEIQLVKRNHCNDDDDHTERERDPRIAREASHDVADEARDHNERRVGNLRGNVAQVVALCARRGEDRRIGYRRDVVAIDRTRHSRRC